MSNLLNILKVIDLALMATDTVFEMRLVQAKLKVFVDENRDPTDAEWADLRASIELHTDALDRAADAARNAGA